MKKTSKQFSQCHDIVLNCCIGLSFPYKFDPCPCDFKIKKVHTLLMEIMYTNFELIVNQITNLACDWRKTLCPYVDRAIKVEFKS